MNKDILTKSQICSIICSYYPNRQILRNLCQTLSLYSDVYIVDNSQHLQEDTFSENDSLTIVKTEINLGTSKAYNHVIENFPQYEYYWLWDQDTSISSESAEKFLEISKQQFFEESKLVATTFYDPTTIAHPLKKGVILIKGSSSLFRKDRVEKFVGSWFDEHLFMDYGDWDFSYRIQQNGGKVTQIKGIEYQHIFGEPEKTILGEKFRSSMNRLYMQGLNSAYFFKKWKNSSFIATLLLGRAIFLPFKNLLFKNSFRRIVLFFKGIYHGLKGFDSSAYMKKRSE
jgi:GT2 family glycosyltransferase